MDTWFYRVNNRLSIVKPILEDNFALFIDSFYNYQIQDYIMGIGFPDSTSRDYRLFASSSIEQVYEYLPPYCKITTAWYPLLDIRNYKLSPSILLPNGGDVWVDGPDTVGCLLLKFLGYSLYSGGSPILTRINDKGKL